MAMAKYYEANNMEFMLDNPTQDNDLLVDEFLNGAETLFNALNDETITHQIMNAHDNEDQSINATIIVSVKFNADSKEMIQKFLNLLQFDVDAENLVEVE